MLDKILLHKGTLFGLELEIAIDGLTPTLAYIGVTFYNFLNKNIISLTGRLVYHRNTDWETQGKETFFEQLQDIVTCLADFDVIEWSEWCNENENLIVIR